MYGHKLTYITDYGKNWFRIRAMTVIHSLLYVVLIPHETEVNMD